MIVWRLYIAAVPKLDPDTSYVIIYPLLGLIAVIKVQDIMLSA